MRGVVDLSIVDSESNRGLSIWAFSLECQGLAWTIRTIDRAPVVNEMGVSSDGEVASRLVDVDGDTVMTDAPLSMDGTNEHAALAPVENHTIWIGGHGIWIDEHGIVTLMAVEDL